MMDKPIIAVTAGDPAGIGPEIAIKALNQEDIYEICRPVLICGYDVVDNIMRICGIDADIHDISSPERGVYKHGIIDLINTGDVKVSDIEMGRISASSGTAGSQYIEKAVELAISKKVDAIATGPINKEAWKLAGVPYIGHTEMLGGMTGVADPLTMFQVKELRVFFLTRHVSLKKACSMITYDRVYGYIKRCDKALRQLGIKQPCQAVAGLNPHAGEHGLFGDEESAIIEPAIKDAKAEGFEVYGPLPADSVFMSALRGSYDAVLSMYHDQGHIAAKMVDFERTVALTLGLPFLRTSVDHGTAFDIAGKGIASAVSMAEAIRVAARYARMYSA
jgi:4-hydroxythreonine-4-phosphate dehydrogenase